MSSQDNEDFKNLNLPDPQVSIIDYIGVNGLPSEKDYAFAKIVTTNLDYDNVSTQYFVLVGRGEVLDPYSVDSGYSKKKLSSMYKYRRVSKQCFDSYIKYLETKNRIHFTTARRSLMG